MKDSVIPVCFIAPKAYPLFEPENQGVFGGAEVDIFLLATELAKDKNYAVSCIVADYGQPDEEERQGVRLIRSVNFGCNPITGAVQVWKALRRANADIYFHEAASMGTVLAGAFCKLNRKRFVYRTASQRECDGRYLGDKPLVSRLFYRTL